MGPSTAAAAAVAALKRTYGWTGALQLAALPLGPVQPSEPPECLWVQERDQRAPGEDAGCAAGAVVGDEA